MEQASESTVQSGTRAARKLLCVEVNPPKGVNTELTIARLAKHAGSLDYFNVTDNALARVRMGAFFFAAELKRSYPQTQALVNLSCRDRNLLAMQSDLLGAAALGINHPVALTGDAMKVGDNQDRKGVFEVNSVGLLEAIAQLNSGFDMAGCALDGIPEIKPGVVCNPNANNIGAEIRKLEKKAAAGAGFVLSQPVYDSRQAREFMTALRQSRAAGLKVLLGLLPFRNLAGLKNIEAIPGLKVPQELISLAASEPNTEDLRVFAVDYCLELARETADLVDGFHVVCGVNPITGLKLLGALAKIYKADVPETALRLQ